MDGSYDSISHRRWPEDEMVDVSDVKGKEVMLWPGVRKPTEESKDSDHLPGAEPCACENLRSHFTRSFRALGVDISDTSAQIRLFRNMIEQIGTLESKKNDLVSRLQSSEDDSSGFSSSDEEEEFQYLKESVPREGPLNLKFDIRYYDGNSHVANLYSQTLATISKLAYEVDAIRATRTPPKPDTRQRRHRRSPSPVRHGRENAQSRSQSRSRSRSSSDLRRRDRPSTRIVIGSRSPHSQTRGSYLYNDDDYAIASDHGRNPNSDYEGQQRRVHVQDGEADVGNPDWLVVDMTEAGAANESFDEVVSLKQVFLAKLHSGSNPLLLRKGVFPIRRFLERHPEVAFILARRYSCGFVESNDYKRQKPRSRWIEIFSGKLKRTLMSFQNKTQGFIAPWDVLMFHSRLAIESALPTFEPDIRLEVQLLLDATKRDYEQTNALFDSGMVTGSLLERLFRPQEVIVDQKEQQKPLQAYLTGSTALAFSASRGHITLETSQWSFNGTFLLSATDKIIRSPPDTPVEIKSLASYPLRYAAPEVREMLRKRGEKFWLCRRKAFVSYSAPNQVQRTQGPGNYRFMVDYNTYRELHPDAEEFLQETGDDISEEELDSETPPGNGKELIFPANVSGFSIQDKKWKVLLVDHIEPVTWNTRAFERLVLRPTAKELIQAVVQVHLDQNGTSDLMEGKGNGSLILLHGPPGTGKTLTAESVAELVRRPLYRVTCGDVGTDPESVENYLESVLYIAKIWGCVVLMDEADVFLEERTLTDLHRNALVSVFLRVLEYYEGILILTSNRVGTFDEAFKSRIKLALHYTTLGKADRRKIWRNFFKMLKETGSTNMDFDDLDDHLDDLADVKLNGRNIRNAISVARELAQFRNNEKLGYHHIRHVIGVGEEFEEYLETTHGHKTDDWLKENGIRA